MIAGVASRATIYRRIIVGYDHFLGPAHFPTVDARASAPLP